MKPNFENTYNSIAGERIPTCKHILLSTFLFSVNLNSQGNINGNITGATQQALIDFGNKVMRKIPYECLYSRVDVVKNGNNYLLMEVELIEPSLYFNMDSKSPQMFAEVFNKWHG